MNPIAPELRDFLLPGEQPVWTGKPAQGVMFVAMDVFLIPFSILWGGFAIFWNVSVWSGGASIVFSLFGLPFLVIGLYMIFGRFVHDASLRKRLIYAVTNKRVIVLKAGRGRSSTSLDIDRLPMVNVKERSDGRGTISFERPNDFSAAGFGFWVPSLSSGVRFLNIDNVKQVHELIRRQDR